MTDYSKMANNLGLGLHSEFIKGEDAVIPVLQRLLASQPGAVLSSIAEYWGVEPISVNKGLQTLAYTSVGSLPHADVWKFPLRAAQCAALADRRMKASLAVSSEAQSKPREATLKTIHDIGCRAVGLMHGVINPSLLKDTTSVAANWDNETKSRVASLGIRPHGFVRAMAGFMELVAPVNLSELIENGPHKSLQALYRIGTAAAVMGHELKVEYIPFNNDAAAVQKL